MDENNNILEKNNRSDNNLNSKSNGKRKKYQINGNDIPIQYTFDGRNVYWCGKNFAKKYGLNWTILRLQIINGTYNYVKKFINPQDKEHIQKLTDKNRVKSIYGISIRTIQKIFKTKLHHIDCKKELESYKNILRKFIYKKKNMDCIEINIENNNNDNIKRKQFCYKIPPNENNIPSTTIPLILDHIKNKKNNDDNKRKKYFVDDLFIKWKESIAKEECFLSYLMETKNELEEDKVNSIRWLFDENEKEFILQNIINIKK